uniref:Zinc finger domain-containing protein n=1 Tax=Caudovirales sp. ctNZz8 TaxID=2826772 RepID=A0A8S5QZ99_9CAUD|nr:MAG TPA: zinc finger domain-containing protein [Caudovirales sp. ctNZz8]
METVNVTCDYCGRKAELVDSKVIYGKSYGHKVWLCRRCMAYVGCHKGTDKPLGRLANAELRYWKRAAHYAFDPLWKHGKFKGYRNAAYGWLSQKMGLPVEKTHIGMFDVAECKKAIEIIRREKMKGVSHDRI